MMAAELWSIDFKATQGEWTIQNDELGGLDYVWAQDSRYGMKASGYVDGNHATDATLISPKFDLSEAASATLNFSHARKYGSNDQLSVLARADEGEWAVLEVSAWPDGSSWTYIDATADLAAFIGMANVQVAFRYTSTEEGGATWEIGSASVFTDGEGPVGADVTFLASDFAGQGTSSTGSEVSVTKDGVTVSSDKAFGHDAALRVYKNGSFSIVSETEQIGKIVFSFGSYQGTPKDGGLASEIVVNAKEWNVESMASAGWFEKIEIYFGEYEPIDPDPDPEPLPEGVISCDSAVVLAAAIEDPVEVKSTVEGGPVTVRGYVTYAYDSSERDGVKKQSAWLSDTKGSRAGTIQGSYLVITEDVVVGDYVEISGTLAKYLKEGKDGKPNEVIIEVINGTMNKVGAQGIENIELTEKAQKVMVDGVMYIVRDGKMFNIQGAQVR